MYILNVSFVKPFPDTLVECGIHVAKYQFETLESVVKIINSYIKNPYCELVKVSIDSIKRRKK